MTASSSSGLSLRDRDPVQLVGRDLGRDLDAALLVDRIGGYRLVDDRGIHLAGEQRSDRGGPLGEAAHLGGIGLVVGVRLTGVPSWAATILPARSSTEVMSEPSGTSSACWAS